MHDRRRSKKKNRSSNRYEDNFNRWFPIAFPVIIVIVFLALAFGLGFGLRRETTPAPTVSPTPPVAPTAPPTTPPTAPTAPTVPHVPVPPGEGKCCLLDASPVCEITSQSNCVANDARNFWIEPFVVPCVPSEDPCSGACFRPGCPANNCTIETFPDCYNANGEIVPEETCSSVSCEEELGTCCYTNCALGDQGCTQGFTTRPICDAMLQGSETYVYVKGSQTCNSCMGACCDSGVCTVTTYCNCQGPTQTFTFNGGTCNPYPCSE